MTEKWLKEKSPRTETHSICEVQLPWIAWARAHLDRLGSAEAQREGGLRIAAVYGPGVK